MNGLGCEKIEDIEDMLNKIKYDVEKYIHNSSLLIDYPSIRFALESAYLDYSNGGKSIYFPSEFSSGNDFIICIEQF